MQPILRSLFVRTTDVGGGGGAPAPAEAPASPADAANARIEAAVAAGLRDGDPETGAPVETPPEGSETQPAADVEPDFDNLSYRDGKKLREQFTAQKERYKPFEEAVGTLPDDQRQAAVEALGALGADSATILPFVAQMPDNDRQVIFGAYQTFLEKGRTDPEGAAQAFRDIADMIAPAGAPTAPPSGPPPAGAPADPGAPDPDAPLTRAEYLQMQAEQRATAEQEQAARAAEQTMLADLKGLGYDPDSSDPAERSRADEVIWLAAYRTEGDLRKAHAEVESRTQSIIDGYVKGKKANASTPGTPETGQSPSGSTPPGKVDPRQAMEARLEANLGPDPQARV